MIRLLQLLKFTIVLSICTGFANSSKKYKYESSYAFLDVHRENGGVVQICVNFQQWRSRDLPASPIDSPSRKLNWWVGPNGTDICNRRASGSAFSVADIVPADYRTRMSELKDCRGSRGFNESDSRAVWNQVELMKGEGVQNILFLVKKGNPNGYGLHDYLFTYFYNSEIDDTDEGLNVFFAYEDIFWQHLQPRVDEDGNALVDLRIHQPQSSLPMDPAVAVLWSFAFFSILIGSLWAAVETKARMAKAVELADGGTSQTELTMEEGSGMAGQLQTTSDTPPTITRTGTSKGKMKRTESAEIAQMSSCQHCVSVLLALFIVVLVLMLAFFFRNYAVHVFNVFLLILGTFSLHSCLYGLLQLAIGQNDYQIGTFRQICCKYCPARGHGLEGEEEEDGSPSPSTSFPDRPVLLLSSGLFLLSAGLCLSWFAVRNQFYAFLLLDPINVAICIYSIRASRIRSLRLITFLLLAMFVYDLFMVFGTRLLTPDGCSVMLQVVTGVDCRPSSSAEGRKGREYQPIAPIEADLPEKLPLLFYMPMLADPMGACYDVHVEREFKHVMLGLGDVILPGYLVAFCFYVDAVEGNRFRTYGLISLLGYSLGMLCTFVALLLMEVGQPALIYLVPCTLLPTCLWALFGDKKGTLGRMWRGQI